LLKTSLSKQILNNVMSNLKLQVLWLDNSLGLAVNQETIPLTPYYFWPISEAWEQIRFELDSKQWIPEEERIRLLNLIVDSMNRWQKSREIITGNYKTIEIPSSETTFTVKGLT